MGEQTDAAAPARDCLWGPISLAPTGNLLLRLCGDEHNAGAFSWCLIKARCPALWFDVYGGSPGALFCSGMRQRCREGHCGVLLQVPVTGVGAAGAPLLSRK